MMEATKAASARRVQWSVLFPAGFALALSLAGDLTLYAVLPAYATGIGLSLGTLSVLLSANRLIRLISNPLVGLLADRFDRRKMFLTGLTTGVISTIFYVLAKGFWAFLLGRLLWGVSWSILYIGIFCMVVDVTDDQDRGWGLGILQTFYFFGLMLNPIIGGLLADQFGFFTALLVCAAIQAVGLVCALFFLPTTHPTGQATKPERKPLQFSFSKTWQTVTAWIRSLSRDWFIRNKEIISANYLYLLTLFIGDGFIMSTITLYIKQRYGTGISIGQMVVPVATVGGVLIALRAAISAGAAPLAGNWSKNAGARWIITVWGTLCAIAGCVFLSIGSNFGMILLGIVLASIGSGMLMAVLPVIVSTVSGAQSSLSMGILTTSGDIGCAIAPLVSYALLNSLSLSQLYLISAVLLVTGGALALTLVKRREVKQL
jgi:MFS family permease